MTGKLLIGGFVLKGDNHEEPIGGDAPSSVDMALLPTTVDMFFGSLVRLS